MACPALTNKGGTFAISNAPVTDCELDEAGFELLTFIEVGSVGSSGDTGYTQDVTSYPVWDVGLTPQGKGDATGNNPTIEFLYRPSAGMTQMLEAAEIDNQDNYAWRYTWANGDVEYGLGLVSSPTHLKGAGSDMRRISFVLIANQEPVLVDATSP